MRDVGYNAGRDPILKGITLTVGQGEFVCLVGSSGAGKSTILRMIHMEIFPTHGSVHVANYDALRITAREIPYFRRKVGMIFQDFKLLEDRDVFENVAFALWATGTKRNRIKKRVFSMLAEMGLTHKRFAPVYELSGGEQQRVAIARALVNEPFVLLADEPTGNLDPANAADILGLLRRINSRGMAVLMATHKEDIGSHVPARIVHIEAGRIVG